MIALIAATASGRARAEHLAAALPEARILPGRPSEALPRAFAEADGVVLFLAVGAAVRLVAPLLAGKDTDPGVVCVDDAGALRGRPGRRPRRGRQRPGRARGRRPGRRARGDHGERRHRPAAPWTSWPPRSAPGSRRAARSRAVGAALVGGEPVALVADRRWPLGPLPPNVEPREPGRRRVRARGLRPRRRSGGRRRRPARGPAPALARRRGRVQPRGECRARSSTCSTRRSADAGLASDSLSALASIDVKADEPGLLEAARERGLELRLFPAADLAEVPVPTPSAVVREAVGTPSVAEAAALLAAAEPSRPERLPEPPELVVAKRKSAMATVASPGARSAAGSRWSGSARATRRCSPSWPATPCAAPSSWSGSSATSIRSATCSPRARASRATAWARRWSAAAARSPRPRPAGRWRLSRAATSGSTPWPRPALEEGGLENVDVEVVPGITAARGGRGPGRLAARARPLLDLAVRPAHALGGDPRPAARRRAGRLRRSRCTTRAAARATGSSTRRARSCSRSARRTPRSRSSPTRTGPGQRVALTTLGRARRP